MLQIDGSYHEGGGQIIRTALALSMITGIPFEADKIRAGREKPGLKAQHLTAINALEKMGGAKAEGASLGSQALKFYPGKISGRRFKIDIGTAGSVTLLLQSLLLPCFFSGRQLKLEITGGTDVAWSIPINCMQNVILPQLKKFCSEIKISVLKRGYYPEGNGVIEMRMKPLFDSIEAAKSHNKKIILAEQGKLVYVRGVSHASKSLQKQMVAERQASGAKQTLSRLGVPIQIYEEYSESIATGSGITLWAVFSSNGEIDEFNPIILGGDALGERGKQAEIVGREAAEKLLAEIKSSAACDKHLADNLIPWMALFKPSRIMVSEVTPHTLTNIYTTELFMGTCFRVERKVIETY